MSVALRRPSPETREGFAADVRRGLGGPGPKTLPSKYLYDERGSALFEAITELPEYGLTRAEERILARHAGELPDLLGPAPAIAELGSGSGRKTRLILEAFARRHPTSYFPIEISRSALAASAITLGKVPGVTFHAVAAEYLPGLEDVTLRRPARTPLLVLFLGSSIGNFDRPEGVRFLQRVRALLRPGDALLLATDLEHDRMRLTRAYDDPAGVTAAFDLNLLTRMNRELGADFDPAGFRHEARYDASERRVEMHLRSLRNQHVSIPRAGLDLSIRKGEGIWTESSHKYALDEVDRMAAAAGFWCAGRWTDAEWPFADSLLRTS